MSIEQLLQRFERSNGVLLTGHEHPDGDCLGAQVALVALLEELGTPVRIVNPDPVPRNLDFLQRHTTFGVFDGRLPDGDLAVLLDCANLSRLGRLGRALADDGRELAVIDHHVGSEDGDGSLCYVDSTAAATGALVYRLYRHLGRAPSAVAAEGVFLSLVADTGWFRYSNTSSEVLAIAAELVGAGVDSAWMYDQMFRRNRAESVEILADTLGKSAVILNGRYGVITLDKVAVERAARLGFDTDLVLDPVRSIGGIEVVALFKERFDGGVKVSLRASRDVDVQAIAGALGGGGHRKAAGATVQAPLAQAQAMVEDLVRDALAAREGEPA